MSLNRVQLLGNIAKDLELKKSATGTSYINFSVATNKNKKDKNGEWQKETQFHNLVAFGSTADTISTFLEKGHKAYFEGELQHDSYEKDGVKKYTTKIIVSMVEFIAPAMVKNDRAQTNTFDDIPF